MDHKALTEAIIGAAIEVHRALGSGLLESAYEQCLCHELHLRRITFECQRPLPVQYQGVRLDCGYRLDLLVMNEVVVEIKAIDELHAVHEAQLLTYLKLGGWKIGFAHQLQRRTPAPGHQASRTRLARMNFFSASSAPLR